MAPRSTIADRICMALAEYLKRPRNAIQPDQSLRDDLGLDSMATIELLFRIEETFDFQIPDQDLQRLATVGDVIAYVEERVAPQPSARASKPSARRRAAKNPTATKKAR